VNCNSASVCQIQLLTNFDHDYHFKKAEETHNTFLKLTSSNKRIISHGSFIANMSILNSFSPADKNATTH
jgi:hypothetical protein